MLKHNLKRIWDKPGRKHVCYCDTCEISYDEDGIRAGLCPAVIGVSCNQCLESMAEQDEDLAHRLGDTYGLEAKFDTGFQSTALQDGYMYRFNLCESCIVELFKKFDRPPERRAYIGGEEGEHRWHDDLQFEAKDTH